MKNKIRLDLTNHKDNTVIRNVILRMFIPDFASIIPDELEVDISEDVPYQELKKIYDEGVPIHNIIGGFLVDRSVLDESVPVGFDNSILTISEEETRQKTWREYTITYEKATKGLITIGWRNEKGNRQEIVSQIGRAHV